MWGLEKMNNYILGTGMTGLAARFAQSSPVYEAADMPGVICSWK